MVFNPRFANRIIAKYLRTAYAVKDNWGVIGWRGNSLTIAKRMLKRARLTPGNRGATFSIWTGKGFTVKLDFRYTGGSRRGR